jgi:hypothetical protein
LPGWYQYLRQAVVGYWFAELLQNGVWIVGYFELKRKEAGDEDVPSKPVSKKKVVRRKTKQPVPVTAITRGRQVR